MDDLFGALPKLSRAQAQALIERRCSGYEQEVGLSTLKVASALAEFTPEDVRAWCEPARGEENRFSAAIAQVVDLALIKPVRMTRAKRKSAHGRKIPVYQRAFEL
jgi:hypothetical protein